MNEDTIDRFIAQWRRERPDLELEPMALMGRLFRANRQLGDLVAPVAQEFGISGGEFDLLSALRRAGEPYRLSPSALVRNLWLSSGAMTNRIDQLEKRNLVRRRPDPADRRGILVELTPEGFELIEAAVVEHIENEKRLLAVLSAEEQAQLDGLLRKLLLAYETKPD